MTARKVLTANEVLALADKTASDKATVTSVERPLDQENDLGNLLGVEINEFDLSSSDSQEKQLKVIARDNCQLLLNGIWQLPSERIEDAIVAVLPPPTTKIPREKPVPKPKPLTKWEQYAKEKGIVKQKKARMVWDDIVKEWVPRFGYKKAKAEAEKNWVMEYKEGQDQDPFEKAIEEKRERVAKNELQRLRNIARAKNTKVPAVGLTPTTSVDPQTSGDLKKASEIAKKSTASLGKFQENLPKSLEKNLKAPKGKKRKFDPLVGDANEEKAKNLKVLEQITSKQPKLDVSKSVGHQINEEERSRAEEKRSGKKKAVGKKGGKGQKRNRSSFDPKKSKRGGGNPRGGMSRGGGGSRGGMSRGGMSRGGGSRGGGSRGGMSRGGGGGRGGRGRGGGGRGRGK